jgi:MoxR-like ATPase
MSDRQVSVDGVSRPLPAPFLVLATQNPFEFEGTYPLPESQLDRFLLRLRLGYPDRDAERRILTSHRDGEPIDHLTSVLAAADVVALQQTTRQTRIDLSLADYVLDLVAATRQHPDIALGGSTRAALGLYRAAQALAFVEGRDFVVPDDVKRLAGPVLAHRLLPRSSAPGGAAADEAVADVLRRVPVPR